jgi:ATP-dependent DNA ligase
MALSYISGGRVSWRDVLAYVVVKGNITSGSVAAGLGLSHPDASIRLRRLKEWGMVRTDGKARGRAFSATEYGVKVARNPSNTLKNAPEAVKDEPESLGSLYPELGAPALASGPVALMRVVEVDYPEFERKGLEALPSRVELSEDTVVVEKKYDGWLCQTAGGRLYSRRGIELTENFIPIAKELSGLRGSHLVGELVYWDHRIAKMVETNVTRVAGTESPAEAGRKFRELETSGFFQIVFFDVIAADGEDVSKAPFEKRRKLLERLIDTEDDRRERVTRSSVHDFSEWKRVFQATLSMGGEGVMLKNSQAPYLWNPLGQREPRPSGVQWKVKAKRSDDFIVFGWKKTEKGSVSLRFGQFCRGELIEVGDVNSLSSGTEKEVVALLAKGPFVAEIEFQERFPKHPGRLRNPVFVRVRLDKPIESVTMPEEYCR